MLSKKTNEYLLFSLDSISILIFSIGYVLGNNDVMFFAECLLLFLLLFKIFINKSFLIFLFVCIFIFFQMSRLFLDFFNLSDLEWYRGYVGDYFDAEIQKHVLLCFFLVFQGLYLALFSKIKQVDKIPNSKYLSSTKINIKISYFLCIIFLIPSIAQNILAVKYVFSNGYFAYYKSFSPPYILTVLSGMSYVFIFIYLCTTKKLSKCFILLYVVNFVSSLLIGSRKDFVLYLLLLVFYFWNIKGNFSLRILKKLIIPVVLLFSLLFFVGFAREDAVNSISKFKVNPLVLFLDSQGVSVVVPSYSKMYEDDIPKKGIAYLFPNQIRMVTNLLGTTIDKSDRKKDALEGFYISKYISYRVLGDRFIVGEGLGGSFITDMYYCFSYLGVFLFSYIIGIFMRFCERARKNNIKYILILSCVYNLLYIPRSQAFDIFIQITSIKFWVAILFYILINEIIRYTLKGGKNYEHCLSDSLLSK